MPLAAAYAPEPGTWNIAGWTLVFGGMFIAAWSAYAFETSICFTSEFKNPARDTVRAILYSGLLCLVLYSLVPFTFQGVLGLDGMLAEAYRRRNGRRQRRWRRWSAAPASSPPS